MAGKYDFIIEQGIRFTRPITWKDDAGNPVNLSGSTATLTIRDTADTVILTLTDGAGLTLGGPTGIITVSLTAAQTDALSFDTAYYELDILQAGVPTKRLLKGVITLDARGAQ